MNNCGKIEKKEQFECFEELSLCVFVTQRVFWEFCLS